LPRQRRRGRRQFAPGRGGFAAVSPVVRDEPDVTLTYKGAIDLDNFDLKKIPPGFVPLVSGVGQEASWEVPLEPSAPSGTKVLAQTTSDPHADRFPIVLYDKLLARNVDVSVQFKTISGKLDQAAGVVLRFPDPAHYYVVRANALEGEINFYKVINGALQVIAKATAAVSADAWHTLRVTAVETHFIVSLDNQTLLGADDAALRRPGKIGLSTQADSVTVFDNLHIESHDA
jgi:hypothetical protein